MPGPTVDNAEVLLAAIVVGATPTEGSAFTIAAGANAILFFVSIIITDPPPVSVAWKVGETTQEATLVEFVIPGAGADITISAWRLDNPTIGEGTAVIEVDITQAVVLTAVSIAGAGETRAIGTNTSDGLADGLAVSEDAIENDLVITGVSKRNDSELIASIDADTTLENTSTTSMGASGVCQIVGAETAAGDGTITHTASFSPDRPGAGVMLVIGPAPEPPEPPEPSPGRGRTRTRNDWTRGHLAT
ncbi:MAG: hypothetical protein EA376_00905 [Phycisphaeraceae bacterium]|nr:MAG: hypothetical protein EA376_00905 [Phycisphaeraceae bacterium]